jgi:hypothetical protein
MPFTVPAGAKFSCVVSEYARFNANLADDLDLGNGLWAVFRFPFDLGGHWREWLGSVRSDWIQRSNFLLFAVGMEGDPNILDNGNETLKDRVFGFLYGLHMQETVDLGHKVLLRGAHTENGIDIRSASDISALYTPRGAHTIPIARNQLEVAAAVESGLRTILYGQSYHRLRRGFYAWTQGLMQYRGDQRLHQFVRSVEAIVKPEAGRNLRLFAHRGQLFAGTNAEAKDLLEELYELRSCAEHMNDFVQVLNGYPADERDQIGSLRAFQAERLAGSVYTRLLTTAALLPSFADDDSINEFWREEWAMQRDRWGAPIDLLALGGRDHFEL